MLRWFINPIYFWVTVSYFPNITRKIYSRKDVFELVPAKASNIEGFSN